ncbi:MAG: hypothetical protein JSS76_11190 [Bacteroidetes bacterium]|nr:hypothetical protein [Bacteroidota bacterium]
MLHSSPCRRSLFLIALLVTAVCFLFTYLYYGFFYVEYEGMFDSFYSGRLTGGMPFRSVYFLGNIGTSHVYSMLYQLYPGIEWISWFLYSYLFLSCLLTIYIILCIVVDKAGAGMGIIVSVLVYFLVFADSNIHFLFTRVSYMLAGSSLLGLVYFFGAPGSISRRKILFTLLCGGFVLGTLTRSESATAVLLQVAVFGFFYIKNVRQFVSVFLFPVLFLGVVLAAIAYDLSTTPYFYKQVEPDIEAQFTDRENAVPLSQMHSYRDTAKWEIVKNIIWVDPGVLTPSYMRSLILPERPLYTDVRQWSRVRGAMTGMAARFWYLCLISCLLSLALLIRRWPQSAWDLLQWLLLAVSFWILIAMQTYTDKVNDRSFLPLLDIFILAQLIAVLPALLTQRRMIPLVLVGLTLFMIHMSRLSAEADTLSRYRAAYRRNLATITHVAGGKVLAVNSSSCDYLFLSNEPFHSFDFSAFCKVYVTDGFNIPFLPYYRRYLERECRCDIAAFPSFWDYLRSHHQDVVIVSTPRHLSVLRSYMEAIHDYSLPVSADTGTTLLTLQKSDTRDISDSLQIYHLGH